MTAPTQLLQTFADIFEQKLNEALQEKTSWGRNDLKILIKEVQFQALLATIHSGA